MPREKPARRRRRFRPILTLSLSLVALLAMWVGVEVYFAYTARPAIQHNYGKLLREEVESWQEIGGVNGWVFLSEAVHAHSAFGGNLKDEVTGMTWNNGSWAYATIVDPEDTRVLLRETVGSDLTREEADIQFELLRGWAIESLNSFATNGVDAGLDRFLSSQYALCEIADSSLESKRSFHIESTPIRRLIDGLQARCALSAQRGDWKDYRKAVEYVLAISQAARYQPGVLIRLVGHAEHAELLGYIASQINSQVIPPATMEELTKLIALYDLRPTSEQFYRSNKLIMSNDMQYYFGQNGRLIMTESDSIGAPRAKPHWIINIKGLWLPRWASFEEAVNQAIEEHVQISRMGFRDRVDAHEQYRAQSISGLEPSASGFHSLKSFGDQYLGNEVAYRIANQDMQADVLIDGLRLLLAIELFRAKEGRYPYGLEELVPTHIEAIPLDPYNENNSLWRYRRLIEPDETGRQFVLYSIGYDMIDNMGTRPRGYFTQALDSYNDGMDFVISHPPLHDAADDSPLPRPPNPH